jgi:hypothetical protein
MKLTVGLSRVGIYGDIHVLVMIVDHGLEYPNVAGYIVFKRTYNSPEAQRSSFVLHDPLLIAARQHRTAPYRRYRDLHLMRLASSNT